MPRSRSALAATLGLPLLATLVPVFGTPSPAGAVPPFTVGATTSVGDTVGSGNTCAGFLDERTHLGPLAVRRVFTAGGAPPTADAVDCHVLQGGTLWYSFKTSCSPAGVAAGLCDGEIQAIATAMPSGSYRNAG